MPAENDNDRFSLPFITENGTAALRQQLPEIRSDGAAMISRASTQRHIRPNTAQEQEHP